MDPDQELSALEVVNEWPERRIADAIRDYGEERHARRVAREIVSRRPPDHLAARRGDPRGAAAGGALRARPSRKRTFQESASPSTASSRRSTSRCPPRGSSCAPAGASPRSPSTRSRTGASSASSPRARPGAPAPRDPGLRLRPDPEAELLSRRAIAPTPEEARTIRARGRPTCAARSSSRTGEADAPSRARRLRGRAPRKPSRPSRTTKPRPSAKPRRGAASRDNPARRVDPRGGRPRREPRRPG